MKRQLTLLFILQLVVAVGFVGWCWVQSGCLFQECVPTGVAVGTTCWLVGLKVFQAELGATGVVLLVRKYSKH